MDAQRLVETYIRCLSAGDMEGVLALFTADAIVHSPLYGDLGATEFYTKLAADTRSSEIRFTELFQSTTNTQSLALRFTYRWRLASGLEKVFDCVDILCTNEAMDIRELTIIYDTHPRPF